MMKRTIGATVGLVLIVILAFVTCACQTTAIWGEQRETSSGQDVNVTEVNGSEKYIVYAALNASGNLIKRPTEGEPEATAAYAVVGYTGLVAELVIPAQYNGKNVTKVLVATPYSDYYCYRDGAAYSGNDARLANNTVVKSIVFGSNVTFVGSGVCIAMTNLESVSFRSATTVAVGKSAFAGCFSLEDISFACESSVTLGTGAFATCPNIASVSFACASGSVALNGNFSDLASGAVTYAS